MNKAVSFPSCGQVRSTTATGTKTRSQLSEGFRSDFTLVIQTTAADARPWLRTLSQQSINDQQEGGANGGDENPAEVERLDLAEPNEAAQKTAPDSNFAFSSIVISATRDLALET
jgi:hypothetical protein